MPQQTDNNAATPHDEDGSDGATVADKLRERERERENLRRRDEFYRSVDLKESQIQKAFPAAFKSLLADQTTGKNIIWATRDYENFKPCEFKLYNERFATDVLVEEDLAQDFIKPRCVKSQKEQRSRTKERAEVFTPSWVCNKQNNLIDEAWFGEKCVFNRENNKNCVETWAPIPEGAKHRGRIVFPPSAGVGKGKSWHDYVELVRMEIACGEAPYLVSRYDSARQKRKPTVIRISRRIGLLDRKLRVVSENTSTREEFFEWVKRAFQSIYAFEFQGDSLLLARENLLFSFYDYFYHKFSEAPSPEQMADIAEIISWNVFQMDAMTYAVPFSRVDQPLFGNTLCKVKDWKTGETITFASLVNSTEKK